MKNALFLAVLYYLSALTSSAPSSGPVIRGNPYLALESESARASPRQFPWIVSIQIPEKDGKWQHKCGGSLIAVRDGQTESDIVVSAAHCFDECSCDSKNSPDRETCHADLIQRGTSISNYRFVAGEHALTDDDPEEQKLSPVFVRCHQRYEECIHTNDIALVKLTSPVKFTENIQPIRLPAHGENPDSTGDLECQIAGWGWMGLAESPNILRYANISIYDQGSCGQWWMRAGYDPDLMICAGHDWESLNTTMRQVGCGGDSGGPLTCPSENGGENILVGVVSRGANGFCHGAGAIQPDVYTKVASYVDWILHDAEEMTSIKGE